MSGFRPHGSTTRNRRMISHDELQLQTLRRDSWSAGGEMGSIGFRNVLKKARAVSGRFGHKFERCLLDIVRTENFQGWKNSKGTFSEELAGCPMVTIVIRKSSASNN